MHPSASSVPLLLVPTFIVGLALYFVLSYRRGWAVLARLYPGPSAFGGRKHGAQNGIVGGLGFQNSLEAGADARGLYLAAPALLPPLFIPWEDITVTPRKGLLTGNLAFRFQRAPGITVTLGQTLGGQLLLARPAPWSRAARPVAGRPPQVL